MRFVALPIVLVLAASLGAPAARAGLPGYGQSTIPAHVRVVGCGPAGPDHALGRVTVVIRDLANNPVPSSVVAFDFGQFTDLALALDQLDPRLTVNCATRAVLAVTDQNGRADFTVVGSGIPGAASPPNSLHIYADGLLLGSPSVAMLDRDGTGGLTSLDLSLWVADFFSGNYFERADLDGDGEVSGPDLSLWAAAYFSGNNSQPIGAFCP